MRLMSAARFSIGGECSLIAERTSRTPPIAGASSSGTGRLRLRSVKRVTEIAGKARNKLLETWDIETLSNAPDPTSASNETSVMQLGEFDGQRILLTADVGPEGLNEAADYAALLGKLKIPHMVQVPHHGNRRNVTPNVLDRWLGGKVASGVTCGSAICSVGDGKPEYPHGQVSNAFLRRGYPVYVTRGNTIMHHSGSSRGWPSSTPIPLRTEVEDKAAPGVAA